MKNAVRLGLAAVVALVIALGATTTAQASNNGNASGSTTGKTLTATAAVAFSGNAVSGGGGTVSMGVPATCWYVPLEMPGGAGSPPLNSNDPASWKAWYDWMVTNTNGTFAPARVAYGDWETWQAALTAGKQVYQAECRDGSGCAINAFVGGSPIGLGGQWGPCGVIPTVGFFTPGAPPPPLVTPQDLAVVARNQMELLAPQVDRNPKAASPAGATLVGLPTWFWVTDARSVGAGTGGERTVRASVGNAWALVVARTDGLRLDSPGGGTSCTPTQANVHYSAGSSDAGACTLSFDRASVGYSSGYPVTASALWAVSWTGSGGTGGNLDATAMTYSTNVPVAESQALVGG